MISATLATRLQHIEASPTLALAAKAKELAEAGHPVIDLTAGEPDWPTPEPIKQAAIRAIQANHTRYTPVAGIPALREAVARTVNDLRGTDYQASQTLVTSGGKHALYNIFQALCQPGDAVIVLSPYWVSFPPLVSLSGARPVLVETREEDGFVPDPAAIRAAVSAETKAIIVNSPSNPTGTVIPPEALEGIAGIAQERDLIVVSDEIYDRFVYPPHQHRSIVQVVPEMTERTLVVGAVSKTYSMTGWRIGYVCGPQPWIEAMSKIQSHSTSNPTSISQHAALAALTGSQESVTQMVEAFRQRRDRMVRGLNDLPGCRCRLPEGAFYAWTNVSRLGSSAAELARQWLEDIHVATVPGEGFGAPGYVRLSFAASLDQIGEGLKRLDTWIRRARARS